MVGRASLAHRLIFSPLRVPGLLQGLIRVFLRVHGFITRVNKGISPGTWFHYKVGKRYFSGYLISLKGLIKVFLRVPGFISRFDRDISPGTWFISRFEKGISPGTWFHYKG